MSRAGRPTQCRSTEWFKGGEEQRDGGHATRIRKPRSVRVRRLRVLLPPEFLLIGRKRRLRLRRNEETVSCIETLLTGSPESCEHSHPARTTSTLAPTFF
ncbi:hypothetical protein KM043_011224 [Ampulex compressa]|nr:hypothetical protein KM043_011224 [Ampulex compressa]